MCTHTNTPPRMHAFPCLPYIVCMCLRLLTLCVPAQKKISAMATSGEDITKDGHAARADPDSLPASSG